MNDKDRDLDLQGLIKSFGDLFSGSSGEVSRKDIISRVNEAASSGLLKPTESAMIKNVFSFDEKDAKDIMTHRSEVEALDGDATLREGIKFFEDHLHSRFPVFVENMDNVIGIVHLREMFRYSSRSRDYDKKIRDLDDLIRPAQFIPQTRGINTLFRQMQKQKSHIAIVMDEYGQMSGVVSMEDIIEEIFGDIEDEHDTEPKSIRRRSENEYLMNGHTELSDVEKELNISFEGEEVSTVNGFLTGRLGKIPEEHRQFEIEEQGYLFSVLDVEDRMIQDVIVSKK